jgi:hypothetical protein
MKIRRKEITLENYIDKRGPGWVREKEVDWFHQLQDRDKLRNLANRAVTFGCLICREFDLITNY